MLYLRITQMYIFCMTYLSLSSDWCHVADLFRAQCVDDGTLSNVGVPNEAHTDLFLVCVKLSETDKRGKLQLISYNTKYYLEVLCA